MFHDRLLLQDSLVEPPAATPSFRDVRPGSWGRWKAAMAAMSGTVGNASRVMGTLSSPAWNGATLAPNGKIYCSPHTSANVLVIDPVAGTATQKNWGLDLVTGLGTNRWYGATLGVDGKVYVAGREAKRLLVIDPVNDTARFDDFGVDFGAGGGWYQGIATGPDGKLYLGFEASGFSPDRSILVVDTVNRTGYRIDCSAITVSNMTAGSNGMCIGPAGRIYAPMNNTASGTKVLVIDPYARTAEAKDWGNTLPASAFGGAILGPDGKIYCIPLSGTAILAIDPDADTATYTNMGATISGTLLWQGGALGPDGKIYCFPRNATSILIIDPVAGTATTSTLTASLSGSSKWYGGALAKDGSAIYGCPRSATDVLKIPFTGVRPLPADLPLSALMSAGGGL